MSRVGGGRGDAGGARRAGSQAGRTGPDVSPLPLAQSAPWVRAGCRRCGHGGFTMGVRSERRVAGRLGPRADVPRVRSRTWVARVLGPPVPGCHPWGSFPR